MTQLSEQQQRSKDSKHLTLGHLGQGLLIALVFIGVGVFILSYQTTSTEFIDLSLGDIAPQDILAPLRLDYISEVQTNTARERARNAITPIDSRPDTNVARKQVDRLRKIFDYIDTVRADPYGSLAAKSEWIAAIPDLTLSDLVVDQILITNEEAWTSTKQEALTTLNLAMRAVIKENQVPATRRQLPTLVALDTPDDQANVIVDIVEDMIRPNTFPDEARTETERAAAAAAIEPIRTTIEKNELIISTGQIVDLLKEEALAVLRESQKNTSNGLVDFAAPLVLMLITTIVMAVYLYQFTPSVLRQSKSLSLLTVLFLIFIGVAKIMIPEGNFVYLYPIAALTMIVVILIDVHLALIMTVLLALIAGHIATVKTDEVFIYLVLSGWTGALALGRSQLVSDLRRAGAYVALTNLAVIAVFNLAMIATDRAEMGMLLLTGGVLNVIFSVGLAFVGLLLIGSLAGLTTSIQLLDLSRPTHPLQRQLLLKSPGTYHHSLMVGNLGEQAAERIGADALLVRVMAYYHDIGKIQRPYFFVENQPEGINVHKNLEPQISAQIIISHVTDGLELARKYRLPAAIQDGIAQHQGTDVVRYFYYQALKAAEEKNTQVDEAHFRYPGPKPQSKETGILMLADICETTVRALKPHSAEEIDEIVQKMIADKVNSGQLSECDLTIADLYKIRTAFVDILQGVHHPRIKYPDQVKAEERVEAATGQSPASKDQSQVETAPLPGPALGPAQLSLGTTKPSAQPTPLVRRE
jgi:hypothetical protein